MRSKLGGCFGLLVALAAASTALAHDLDHPVPSFSQPAPLSSALIAGGEDAEWELVATVPTGNPQSDIDFFTRGGETYASVGTLAAGLNSAGQNIIKLTDGGEVSPSYVTGHPSASCVTSPDSATGLQHDSEASPKGNALSQFPNPFIVTSDTQVIIDATDATGRCHDQGTLGLISAPQGGLEIIDVTDPEAPVEIGLTSHVGEAHTVNVDPKRPHIAFVSSSDGVSIVDGTRENETAASNSFDGIEVVDFSSCLNFPAGTSTDDKRTACKPKVFRFRWPQAVWAQSHSYDEVSACHELEIYPDDKVACAGIQASPLLDFSGAFDDNGTPNNYADDKLKGTPLPCKERQSSNQPASPFATGAFVQDCTVTPADASLQVQNWIALGSPSLEGVQLIGTFHHMGFNNQVGNNFEPRYPSKEDIFVAHEAELTQSGKFMLVSDERGGGILPGGATCAPGVDNPIGNGGIHAFRIDRIGTALPSQEDADVRAYQEAVYAKTSDGERAVFRAPINTKPQGAVCTSHVFQQIPGQNRIFMGWYSQGTQVIDFVENADGTIDFKSAGYFIPENANSWVSHVFKVQQNTDGTFTYWGATGDFALGDAGRNAIDIYKVTLPAPPQPRTADGEPPPGTPTFPVSDDKGVDVGADPPACAQASGFNSYSAVPRRKGLRFNFVRNGGNPVRVQVFRHSNGRKVITRRVADFKNKSKSFTWNGKGAKKGYYQVRFTTKAPNQRRDTRQVALRKSGSKFKTAGAFDRRASCELVQYFGLSRPVFGGTKRGSLGITFRLLESATVSFEVSRGGKVVKRIKAKSYSAKKRRTIRVRLGKSAKRGLYRVEMKANRPGKAAELALFSRYL